MAAARPNDPFLLGFLGLSLIVNMALTLVVLRGTSRAPAAQPTLAVGTAIPPIMGRDLTGRNVTIEVRAPEHQRWCTSSRRFVRGARAMCPT